MACSVPKPVGGNPAPGQTPGWPDIAEVSHMMMDAGSPGVRKTGPVKIPEDLSSAGPGSRRTARNLRRRNTVG